MTDTFDYIVRRIDMGEHRARIWNTAGGATDSLGDKKTGGPYVIVDVDGPGPQRPKGESLNVLQNRLLHAGKGTWFDWHPDTGPAFRVKKRLEPTPPPGSIATPYGPIFYSGPCKDDYANIQIWEPGGGQTIKLQAPALASFREACKELGRPIILTGSWRSCAYQSQLYDEDPGRYADPDVTAHTRGLAVDVSTDDPHFEGIRPLLLSRGWHQVRPDDESWHFSFSVTV